MMHLLKFAVNRCFRQGLMALSVCCLFVFASVAQAQTPSTVVGKWRTIDDGNGKPSSIVEVYLENNKLYGRVLQVLQSSQGPHPKCIKCSGERKDQPVEGMVIMWDLTSKDGVQWDNGSILDPKNGTSYRCRVKLASPERLQVRGFVGISLFGRTQTWERIP